jgi:aspartate aminotransferase
MRAVDGVLAALAAHGGDASSWVVGEPCAAPPEALAAALAGAARAGSFPYPPPAGLPRLREVLAARHREGGAGVEASQVVVTAGAKGGLLALLSALLEPDDELIHPLPCYPAYPAMARRLGARAVGVAEAQGSFEGWARAVAGAIGPRTRAVVVASPSNPSGATLSGAQARDLVELCRGRGLRLICDEAYGEFRFAPDTEALPADFDPGRRTVVQLRSASKSWALCGWRVGWVVADAGLAATVAARHASLLNPASGPAQAALTSLPEVPAAYLEEARETVRQRGRELVRALEDAGLAAAPPGGGFYLWLDVRPLLARTGAGSAAELALSLAREHGVGLWPGEDFGSPHHLRIAVTAPPPAAWREALARLVGALA